MERVNSFKGLSRANTPYLIFWSVFYAWVVAFYTWWTSTPTSGQIYTAEIRSVTQGVTLLSAAIVICFYKKEWFVKTLRLGTVALLCVSAVFLFVFPPAWRGFGAPILGTLMGIVCVGILIPYVYIMNNTEKYYGMLFGSIGVNLFSLLYRPEWIDSLGERLSSVFLLLGMLGLALLFKKSDLPAEEPAIPEHAVVPAENKKISRFTLVLNCSFAIFVKCFGKIILDDVSLRAPKDVYLWYFVGGLLGCTLYFVVFAWVRSSLYTIWNLTFASFLLAALCYALASGYSAAAVPVALFVGMSGTMGMITLYYNMGVISRKYRNKNHPKLALWFAVVGGAGSVVLGNVFGPGAAQSTVLALAGISAAVAVTYFIVFPFLLRTYFTEEWVNDSELIEINEMLSEPLKPVPEPPPETIDQTPELTWRENLQASTQERLLEGELAVAGLILRGYKNNEIAEELRYKLETVKSYRKNLYSKLQIHETRELFERAAKTPEEDRE